MLLSGLMCQNGKKETQESVACVAQGAGQRCVPGSQQCSDMELRTRKHKETRDVDTSIGFVM
jgi:hypothetical protein